MFVLSRQDRSSFPGRRTAAFREPIAWLLCQQYLRQQYEMQVISEKISKVCIKSVTKLERMLHLFITQTNCASIATQIEVKRAG